jgi:hypothetical protein
MKDINEQAKAMMDRYDLIVKPEDVYAWGEKFIKTRSDLIVFHNNCRAMSHRAQLHCPPAEGLKLTDVYAQASFHAICFAIMHERHHG